MTMHWTLSIPDLRKGWAPLLLAIGGVIFSLLPWRAPLEEEIGLRLLYSLRGPEIPPDEIVIAGIDDQSAMALETPDDPDDWPRRLHAQLIRKATALGAELVAFDVFFSGPSIVPDADRDMADAMQRNGGVFLTSFVKPRTVPGGIYLESVIEPEPILGEAALATAPFLLPNPSTQANRFLTYFADDEKRATLPVLLFLAHLLRTDPGPLAELVRPFDAPLAASIADPRPAEANGLDLNGMALRLARHVQFQPRFDAALQRAGDDPALPAASQRSLKALGHVLHSTGTRHFRHYGPARTFRTIPYQQLLESPPELHFLSGKILLVGYLENYREESLGRQFITPYSQISSVELAATALANLLEDREITPALSGLQEPWWIFALGAVLGGLAQSGGSLTRSLLALIAAGGAYLAGATLLFQHHGLWLPLVVPLGWQLPAGLVTAAAIHLQRRSLREQKIRSMIHRFVPEDLFTHLTVHEDTRTLPSFGRLAQGVCMATDAGRYTALAETMEPMALARMMNGYYETIFEPVTRRGGWVSDVIGDAMLAVWSAEGNAARARLDALAAALEVQAAVQRFEAEHGLEFPIRMGLHFGEMRVGYIGTAERGEIRAVGDTVNTAARLEALNKFLDTQILVSETLLDGLGPQGVRVLGEFLLPGKSRAVGVAELLSEAQRQHLGPELLARFAEALQSFAEERWADAHRAFAGIHRDFPEDGPTRFYLDTTRAYLADPSLARARIPIDKAGRIQLQSPPP